ncbi:hypothetical protein Tco_0089793 [Tanacetum coccineum]
MARPISCDTYLTTGIMAYISSDKQWKNGAAIEWFTGKLTMKSMSHTHLDNVLKIFKHIDDDLFSFRFSLNGKAKWPTCTSDIDGFCNGGELPGMVRVRTMTYFQDHSWYDELADWQTKRRTLRIEGFKTDRIHGEKLNFLGIKGNNPHLDTNRIIGRNYEASNVGGTQGHDDDMDDPEFQTCKIRRFEMMKYSFHDGEEYISIKESEHLNHSKPSLDAYQELLCLINEGWVVTSPDEQDE